MAILTNCTKICNFTILKHVNSIAKTFVKSSSPKLLNVSNNTPTNFREISQSPQKSDAFIDTDVLQSIRGLKYLRLIKRAIREFDPITEENKRLEILLSKAKQFGLPSNSIDFVQRVCLDSRANLGFLELFLLSNCHFIIQYEDIDLQGTKPYIMRLCEKYDAFMGERNIKWPQSYDQKGIVSVKTHDTSLLIKNVEEAQTTALKFGAQSIKQEVDLEGFTYLQFICEPVDLHRVKKQLDQEGHDVEEAFVGYIPKKEIALSAPKRKVVYSVIHELSKIPTIDNIYTNILFESN